MRDYTPRDRKKLLAFFDELSSAPGGPEAIKSFVGHKVSRRTFAPFVIDIPKVRYTTLVMSPDGERVVGFGQYTVNKHSNNTTKIAIFSGLMLPDHQGRNIDADLNGHLVHRSRNINPEVTAWNTLTLSPKNKLPRLA